MTGLVTPVVGELPGFASSTAEAGLTPGTTKTTRPATESDALPPVTAPAPQPAEPGIGPLPGTVGVALRPVERVVGLVVGAGQRPVKRVAGRVVDLAGAVPRPVRPVTDLVVGVAGAALRPVQPVVALVVGATGALLRPLAPVLGGVVERPPPTGQESGPPAPPPPAVPAVPGEQPATPPAATAEAGEARISAPGDRLRRTSATAGPSVGAGSGLTEPPRQRVAATVGADRGAPPGPGSGFGGCGPAGCAHTTDAISASGQPLVLPSGLAVPPDARGHLVTPPAGLVHAGRRPGVAPLPG
ncbi:hypothetical protein [Phytohabitans kaempferiae]|uniref:Uncharacterized protein n=1 Tax=Phytohabitans kaempferiae TaxID=1620943 RepID=A0ABV6M4R9_9ACTN